MKPTPPQLVNIRWKDTYSMDDDWHASNETKTELRTISTTGFLVTENEEYVVVASTWDEATGRFSNAIAVLQCCVIKRRKISG